MVALASGVTAIAGFAAAAWMPSFFMRVHHLSLIEAGLSLGLGGTIGGTLGGIVGGILADRLSKRDISWQLKIAALGTLLALPAQALVLLWPHADYILLGRLQLPIAVIGVPVSGFFLAFMQGPAIAAVQNLTAPEVRTQATAAFFFITSTLGMGLGPLSVGLLSDVLTPLVAENAVRYGLLASLLFMFLGALLFWRASYFYAAQLGPRTAPKN
jgi:MFS family permease